MEKFKALQELVASTEKDATAFYEKVTKQQGRDCVTRCSS